MSDAFKMDRWPLPVCRGRRPHLRDFDEDGCKAPNGQDMRMEPMLQGASNSWFAHHALGPGDPPGVRQARSNSSTTTGPILEKVQSEQNIELLQQVTPQLRDLVRVHARRNLGGGAGQEGGSGRRSTATPTDLKTPEWEVFIDPESAEKSRDFQLRVVRPPEPLRQVLREDRPGRAAAGGAGAGRLHPDRVAERLRQPGGVSRRASGCRLARRHPTWVPASEIRGEGMFFQFNEDVIQEWVRAGEKPRWRVP